MTKIMEGLIRNVEDKGYDNFQFETIGTICLENRYKIFFFLFSRVRRDEYYPFVQNSQSHAQAGSSQIDITYVYCS